MTIIVSIFFWFIHVAEISSKKIIASYKKCGHVQGGKRIQTCEYDLRLPPELLLGSKRTHILTILNKHYISYHIDKNKNIDLENKGITLELNENNNFIKIYIH